MLAQYTGYGRLVQVTMSHIPGFTKTRMQWLIETNDAALLCRAYSIRSWIQVILITMVEHGF